MKQIVKKKLPFIILISIGIIIVSFFYGKVLVAPNNYMFSNSGDGIKNYFTYAYYIKHNNTYTNFEGMNYPYGENYLYTDCHPILASTFKFLSQSIPFFETHSIGILNLILILSILFTFIILYLLLIELNLNKWISILFSISITLLAPQVFRFSGHFALSYSMAIPLNWLLVLKFIKNPHKYYFILLLLNNMFWMLIHAYLGVITISFALSILLVKILTDKHKKEYITSYILLGVAIIAPVIMFFSFTTLTDSHIGRTANPSGFFLYNAEIDDVLIPSGKPFRPILDKLTGGVINLKWEARGYVGIINTLFFLALISLALVSIFNKSKREVLKSIFNNRILNISIIAATIVLLFALAIPFKQFPNLLEIFPVFKQFRATGRFVWPFYFVFTVFAAYIFQKYIFSKNHSKRRKTIGIVLLILITLISCTEGFYYHNKISKSITKNPNTFNEDFLSEDIKNSISYINPNDYQAIISFPFYYQGSESYGRPRNDKAVRNSLIFSYHSGIPNICTNLTRTSIEESKRIVQLVSPNYYDKKIVNDLPNKKPFLIIKTGSDFTQYESAIIKKGNTIYKTDQIEVLQISFDELFSDDRSSLISEFNEKLPNLFEQQSFLVSDSSHFLYYNNYDDSKSDISFRGKGSFVSIKKGKNTFAEFPPNTFDTKKEYDLSIWMYNGEPDALNLWFRLIVEEYDEVNNKWYSTTFFPEHAEVIYNNWSLIEGTFKVKNPKNKIFIVSKGGENTKARLHIDDLLIKEKNIEVYKFDEPSNSLFFNNHYISMSK